MWYRDDRLEHPDITEMMATGTCKNYRIYYGIEEDDRKFEIEDYMKLRDYFEEKLLNETKEGGKEWKLLNKNAEKVIALRGELQ